MKKPRDVPARDDKYMALAFIHASFSKDPSTQVGAVILNQNNTIVGTGYNGPPRRINDSQIDWERPNKYSYIKHAEANAIKHAMSSTAGCTLYVTGMPCSKCMLDILDAEIYKVVFFDSKKITDAKSMFYNEEEFKTTENLARLGSVQLIPFAGNLNWLRDRIKFLETVGLFG